MTSELNSLRSRVPPPAWPAGAVAERLSSSPVRAGKVALAPIKGMMAEAAKQAPRPPPRRPAKRPVPWARALRQRALQGQNPKPARGQDRRCRAGCIRAGCFWAAHRPQRSGPRVGSPRAPASMSPGSETQPPLPVGSRPRALRPDGSRPTTLPGLPSAWASRRLLHLPPPLPPSSRPLCSHRDRPLRPAARDRKRARLCRGARRDQGGLHPAPGRAGGHWSGRRGVPQTS